MTRNMFTNTATHTIILSAVISLAGLVMVRAADSDAGKKDLEQIQGEWTLVTGTTDGYDIPDAMRPTFKRVCKDDETTVHRGDELIMKAKITIDPSKTPKTIDYQVVDGPTKGQKHLGIYEIDGDTFKSCFAAPDSERPADYTTKQGDKRTSSVWKRAKKS